MNRPWHLQKALGEKRLEGTFGAQLVATPEMTLTLRKDGTFEAFNVVHAVGGPSNNPDSPCRGRGPTSSGSGA